MRPLPAYGGLQLVKSRERPSLDSQYLDRRHRLRVSRVAHLAGAHVGGLSPSGRRGLPTSETPGDLRSRWSTGASDDHLGAPGRIRTCGTWFRNPQAVRRLHAP
jgi:hypothetical protein